MRVKRAGFKPSLNLLYALEGALLDCHWQDVPEERRHELILAADAATALLPPPRNRPAAGPVTTTITSSNGIGRDADAVQDESYARDGSQHDDSHPDAIGADD